MKVEKLQMCRICLVEDVSMFMVTNMELQLLFEKLTGISFVTEDSRPILACFVCCAQLKKCCRFMKKCQEAEEQFAWMLNEEYERKPLINQDQFELFHGFIRTPIENINIVDGGPIEVFAKEELPAVCERRDDIIVPKEEPDSNDGVSEAKEPELYVRITKLEDTTIFQQKKTEQSDLLIIRNTEKHKSAAPSKFTKLVTNSQSISNIVDNTDTAANDRKKTYECDMCHRSCTKKTALIKHIRIHTGEKPYKCKICQKSFNQNSNLKTHVLIHTGEKPYTCDICQKSFSQSINLKRHVLIHTGEKPYKCEICQKSFRKSNDLQRHVRIHTKKTALIKHIRIQTGETLKM